MLLLLLYVRGGRKPPDAKEVAFWGTRVEKLLRELLVSYKLVAVIDVAPGQGTLAVLCALLRIPYIGFGLTDLHTEMLKDRVIALLLQNRFTPGAGGFNPALGKILVKRKAEGEVESPAAGSSEKKRKENPQGDALVAFKKRLETMQKKAAEKQKGEAEEEDEEQEDEEEEEEDEEENASAPDSEEPAE